MRSRGAWAALAGAAAVVAVVVILVVALRPSHKIAASTTTVKLPAQPATTSATAQTTAAATAGSGSTATQSTTSSAAAAARNGVFAGPTETMQYGPVQVEVSVSNGRITGVHVLQTPEDRPRSQFISAQAVPLLDREALAAQSAHIDLITGATFTSDAYAASLQGAIDAAHAGRSSG